MPFQLPEGVFAELAEKISRTVQLPEVIFVPELAEKIGCTPRWIENRLRSHEFPGHKAGRTWVLTSEDCAEILRRIAVPANTPLPPEADEPQGSSMTKTTARRLGTTH
jgi:hypothetical protein